MGPIVDLEADRGEGFDAYLIDDDVAPLNIQSSANIACGFPAGERKYHDGRMRTMEGNLRAPQFARPAVFYSGP
jgi:lactam utilization protein B